MATTPTVNRLQLGSLLRHFRQEANLTQKALGAVVFPKASAKDQQVRIARVETGERQLHDADLQAILAACNVTDPDLLALVGQLQARANKRGRWGGYRAVYSESFRKYVDLETDAGWIRQGSLELVPDLCQTEAYVRALFGTWHDQGFLSPASFPAAVQGRLTRQDVLALDREDGSPVTLDIVMSESCVRRVVGSRAVMDEQLRHLVEMSQRPNITIQIVPFTAQLPGVAFAPYSMLRVPVPGVVSDLDFVYVSVAGDPRYLDDKTAVQWYERNFTALCRSALGTNDTRDYLREIQREYRFR